MKLFGCYTAGPNNAWNPSSDSGTNANWETGVRAFSKNVGYDVNVVNVFPCWGNMNDWPGNLQGIVNGVLKSGFGKNMAVVVGLKMFSQKGQSKSDHPPNGYDWNDKAAYADVASGKWDGVWQGIVKALAGLPYAQIRFSDEYNGSFMEDFMGWDSGAPAWKAAFNRGASVMKKQIADSRLPVEIALNPNLMINCPDVAATLPDLANFDVIAADWYNGFWGEGNINDPAVRRKCWEWPKGGFGLKQYLPLLKSTGKKAFFAECGSGLSSSGAAHGMLNDPLYWPMMRETVDAIRAQGTPFLGMCVWDINPSDGGWRFADGTQPQCLKDFKANIAAFIGDDTLGGGIATSAPIPTAPAAPAAVSLPDVAVGMLSNDTLILRMSEDAYQGDAQFTVAVDGKQVGGTQTAKASHKAGQTQSFVIQGALGAGKHTVSITFLNDAWGGTPATDRNLYCDGMILNGAILPGSNLVLQSNGTQNYSFNK